MCGILCRHVQKREMLADAELPPADVLLSVLETLRHRGPDETGSLEHGAAWLGHTRLAIIDILHGQQPLVNEDGRVAAILNGEIYNHGELRDHLRARGHQFRSACDTEVLVHLYEEYGEDMFRHLVGMFAFVIHDARTGVFLAARDHLGQKPVLYHEADGILHVASELKALLPVMGAARTIDRQALGLYLNCMYVPAPLTIFEGVHKLQPGHYLRHDADGLAIRRYWHPDLHVDWSMSAAAAVEGFDTRFRDSVASQLEADVPLGVFLSGGIDSSAVVAYATRVSSAPLETFTLGMGDGLDERKWARMVAEQYGTRHRDPWAEAGIQDVFPEVMDHFDEPFADTSSLPTYLLACAAREHVKVVLTGEGGDELLAGYEAYLGQAYQRSTRLSTRAGRFLAQAGLGPGHPRAASGPGPRRHWQRLRSVVPDNILPRWLGTAAPDPAAFWQAQRWLPFPDSDPLSQAFEHDFNFYLPDDLLKKVDMASMLTGLETRAPFLDHRLVEFCCRIPPTLKIAGGRPKHILRQAMAAELPRQLLDRPKQGFGAPVTHWVHGPLRELATDLLQPGCRCESWVDPSVVRGTVGRMWARDDADDWRLPLQFWSLLALEWWLRKYV